MLYPVSTWIISPVIPLDKSLDKNNAVLETSSVVIFLLSGDFSLWIFFMSRYPEMTLEERVSRGPADTAFYLISRCPISAAICFISFSRAAFAVPITL